MYFILRSEIEAKGNNFCPRCYKTQIKRLDKSEFYNKYSCWNKDCDFRNTPFAILNHKIEREDEFDPYCDNCREPFIRELNIVDDGITYLIFKCTGKLCETESNPYKYNLVSNNWEGNLPEIKIYDEILEVDRYPEEDVKTNIIPRNEKTSLFGLKNSTSTLVSKSTRVYEISEDIPLLTMSSEEYDSFLKIHNQKVVVLVDLPNFIRTMREHHPNRFEEVIKKSHQLLLKSIKNLFNTSDEYIIRYFSKPDDDLKSSNNLIKDFCKANSSSEYFHLLILGKGKGFSDIDNYLIANGVEILERCALKGFMIVSSDKDYLPVMRIAKYRNIKSYIMGINTPKVYEQYKIADIKFLGMMKYFKK